MRNILLIVVIVSIALLLRSFASDKPDSGDEFTKVKSKYADVLVLRDTAKGEILVIAKILRAKPTIVFDQTAANWCPSGSSACAR